MARSCAITWTQTTDHPHCGRCSQCVDRRLASSGSRPNFPGESLVVVRDCGHEFPRTR